MTIESHINRFCSYFEERLGKIRVLDDPLFKKILLVSMFDTLARVPCPEKKTRSVFLNLSNDSLIGMKKTKSAFFNFLFFWETILTPT